MNTMRHTVMTACFANCSGVAVVCDQHNSNYYFHHMNALNFQITSSYLWNSKSKAPIPAMNVVSILQTRQKATMYLNQYCAEEDTTN